MHKEEFRVNDPMRGGPNSADHVDILGNVDATLDLLKIVTDFDTYTLDQDNIHSNIMNIASKVSSRTEMKAAKNTSRKAIAQGLMRNVQSNIMDMASKVTSSIDTMKSTKMKRSHAEEFILNIQSNIMDIALKISSKADGNSTNIRMNAEEFMLSGLGIE